MTSIEPIWNRSLVGDVEQFLDFPNWWAPVTVETAPIVLDIAVLLDQYRSLGRALDAAFGDLRTPILAEFVQSNLRPMEHRLHALGMDFWRKCEDA